VTTGKILTIAEDRSQRGRHRPKRCLAADKILVDTKRFELRVQPPGPSSIGVAVAEKRPVPDADDFCQDARLQCELIPAAFAANLNKSCNALRPFQSIRTNSARYRARSEQWLMPLER
jgi:hypothetical protein